MNRFSRVDEWTPGVSRYYVSFHICNISKLRVTGERYKER